ncbi:YkgJ family cysteine cluster protein [Konateibacter massiliensis]|uniref:YkgJ family cysteine cluster protein n=1 Tax=Konateibacter massiliensis TaxID=2002841 RepID=UPI000C15436F|nr:YkgJ family cysteine cluster protein [Konateibacter massiliensis]
MSKFIWNLKTKEILNYIKDNQNKIAFNLGVSPNFKDLKDLTDWNSQEIIRATDMINLVEHNCGLKCVCTIGCSKCCSQAIYIDPIEFEMLKYHINFLNKRVKRYLGNTANNICNAVNESLVPFKILHITNDESYNINLEYSKLNKQCLFLNDNICSIYSIRPNTCWTFRQYNNSKYCDIVNKLNYDYSYTGFDTYVTNIRHKYGQKFIDHSEHYLLPYAVRKIINGS